MTAPSKPDQTHKIQPPRGTRDLYPAEAARRRWLTERWREVSVRHGFEEVDGPTFEASDLYAVKSGDGILGELFQAFSGKSPDEVEQVRETGRAPYALRPEFTPTLARMYAAKAAGLPKPCKWFMAGPFFRAERPQRGRLREFLQWNCDVLGLDIPAEKWNAEDAESRAEVARSKARMDIEVITLVVEFLRHVGLTPQDTKVHVNWRPFAECMLLARGVAVEHLDAWLNLLDRVPKIDFDLYLAAASKLGTLSPRAAKVRRVMMRSVNTPLSAHDNVFVSSMRFIQRKGDRLQSLQKAIQARLEHTHESDSPRRLFALTQLLRKVTNALDETTRQASIMTTRYVSYEHTAVTFVEASMRSGIHEWLKPDPRIVRGLAYYTGTVFEVIADGERAVAGGGRYDNLIELFGGPKTPAVGFAMGDVVLSLLLQDKGLMPSDDELMGLVGQHPDVFVLSNGDEAANAQVRPTVAALRRGSDALAGLHVRHSYKATKNVGKLLKEATQQGARFAVIIEDAESCSVKDTRTNEQWPDKIPLTDLHARITAAM